MTGRVERVTAGDRRSCVTAKVWPPMTMLALRAAPLLAATVKLMVVVPFRCRHSRHPAGTSLLVHVQLAGVHLKRACAARGRRVVAGWVQRVAARDRRLRHDKSLAADDDVRVRSGAGVGGDGEIDRRLRPVPLPGTPVIHDGTPLLVQPQPAVVFTANELAPPPAGGLWLPGANE